ncbi:DUF4166 domain-containing protein [Eleftheria terrae]|uniref:DUF4166 domain-containing protein n=1 Tax=Eleftheria terrae TaxID=1597781 RepID=UPI00263A8B81|nr:DUF4166 domain-containing protein [Eleftheria terrae]WKB52816.1 DUF4166 domain-containing protein [Eleftheria terrae]
MVAVMPNTVERWFGARFSELHPLLQALHRHDGRLEGEVELTRGRGLAGWLGARLQRKLGIPLDQDRCRLRVDLRHDEHGLQWSRRFGDGPVLLSVFEPVGQSPSGHWREKTGALTLLLDVATPEGGWHWQVRGARLGPLPLPRWLMPRVHAGKLVVDGRYQFFVRFSMPGLGLLLQYAGQLDAMPAGDAMAATRPVDEAIDKP